MSAAVFLLSPSRFAIMLPNHWTIQMGTDEVPAVGWFLWVSCSFINFMLIAAFSMSGGTPAPDVRQAHVRSAGPHQHARGLADPQRLPDRCRRLADQCMPCVSCSRNRRAAVVARRGMALFLATFQALPGRLLRRRWLHGVLAMAVLLMPVLVFLLGMVLDVHLERIHACCASNRLDPNCLPGRSLRRWACKAR